AAHPIYGYSVYPDSLYAALQNWLQNRHQFSVAREEIMLVAGVVPSLFASVQAFSNKGDAVIVQPPVYAPFFSAITTAQRVVLENPLALLSGRYAIDFDHLEQCAAQAKMLLLCSPHNPVGRVWTETELREILRITRRYNVLIVSDEIHADLIYAGACHTMLAKLASDSDQIITAVAPSKTFNLPGLGLSALIVPNPEHRAALQKSVR
ncbi:MAG: MalY/PatB family protein, partial [Gallionella sp.]